VRHATPDALAGIETLLSSLREFEGLREKKRGTFYRGGSAFLHFHEDPAGIFADVKLDDGVFTRLRVSTQSEQRRLVSAVRRALSSSRGR
jgi:hypothetical protein